MKQVDVVALLLYKNGKILVEKRKLNRRNDPGKTVIPGGHVEQGEPLKKACQRELKEELGIECRKFNFIIKLLHHATIEDQMTYYFSCEGWKGKPIVHEAEKIFWIDSKKLNVLDLEIDKKAVKEFFKRKLYETESF